MRKKIRPNGNETAVTYASHFLGCILKPSRHTAFSFAFDVDVRMAVISKRMMNACCAMSHI